MKKQQNKTTRHHTILMFFASIVTFSLLGGFFYFQAITHVAALMLLDLQSLQLPERMNAIPVPSALLLFGMGFLGLLCVRLAERKKNPQPLRGKKSREGDKWRVDA